MIAYFLLFALVFAQTDSSDSGSNSVIPKQCTGDHQKYDTEEEECVCIDGYFDKDESEPLVCECPEATHEVKEGKCVKKAEEPVEAEYDAAKYIQQTADKKSCECMPTFTEKVGAESFECECAGDKEVKEVEENGVKVTKCVEKETPTPTTSSDSGINGLFVLLAVVMYFLF